tara:strand:+ start:79586 stop:80629 length:1044 start_codon:yes stop_codon:yes gene_type:complete
MTEETAKEYDKPVLKQPPPPELLILDMDSLVYQAALVAQKTEYAAVLDGKEIGTFHSAKAFKIWQEDSEEFGDTLHGLSREDMAKVVREKKTSLGEPEDAYKAFDSIVKQWFEASGCKKWVGYIGNDDSKSNFRYKAAQRFPYKGGRSPEKPHYLKDVREYTKTLPNVRVSRPLYESDDEVVMLSQKYKHKCCIGYIDKDIANTQGCYLFNMNTMEQPVFSSKKVVGTLEKSGNKVEGTGVLHLLHQALIGDTVDNIKCVPKVGPVKSYELLGEFSGADKKYTKDALQVVAGVYKETFGESHTYKHVHTGKEVTVSWQDVLRENLTLLHMIRWEGDTFVDDLMEMLE